MLPSPWRCMFNSLICNLSLSKGERCAPGCLATHPEVFTTLPGVLLTAAATNAWFGSSLRAMRPFVSHITWIQNPNGSVAQASQPKKCLVLNPDCWDLWNTSGTLTTDFRVVSLDIAMTWVVSFGTCCPIVLRKRHHLNFTDNDLPRRNPCGSH